MELSRRDFLKVAGVGAGGILIFKGLGSERGLAAHLKAIPLRKRIGEKITICPYDSVGCGFIVAVEGDSILNIEGDPDHPINQGAACSKGSGLAQVRTIDGKLNPRRLTQVLYRRSGGTEWEPKSWDWAIDQIANKIKQTRDANWIERNTKGNLVNRTEAIAHVGGASNNNEECYLLAKLLRALGVVYVEHQARI